MYEKDGEKYFIVDEHQHFWNARPDNWVEGRENLAKGWIDCFYGYHQLGPPETHWDMEKYQRWTVEDYKHDVFDEGHIDYAVLQSTYLKHWYKEGFNTVERNANRPASRLLQHIDVEVAAGGGHRYPFARRSGADAHTRESQSAIRRN